jgi:SAM-dependent methyltransferase
MMSFSICPLCGEETKFSSHELHTEHKSDSSYTRYRCLSCAGEFWDPLKNPGSDWYEHDERYAGRNQNPILAPQWNHKKTITLLEPRTGSVLDVGCGVGNFLAYAESHGWKGVGIDFDHDAIEAGQKTFGLRSLFVSDIHTFAKTNVQKKYDLVTFFDVLEHIDDHEAFMTTIKGLLIDGGHIAISVPYGAHAKFLMPADVPPRHLTRWNEKSITTFLNRFGFRVTYMECTPASIRFIILKLRFKFGKSVSLGLVQRTTAKTGGGSSAVSAVSFLAKVKDAVLFGIPAVCIWLFLLPSRRRFIGLYVLAHLRQISDGQAHGVSSGAPRGV